MTERQDDLLEDGGAARAGPVPARGPAWALRALAAVAGVLAAATLVLLLVWGRGRVVVELAWFNAFVFTLQAVTCAATSVLVLGRHGVLRDPASYWTGVAFAGYGIALGFYVLAWPGTLPDDASLVAELPGTAAWFSLLAPFLLWAGLLAAAVARWPGEDSLRGGRWIASIAAWLGGTIAVCSVAIAFEAALPPLVLADGRFTPLLGASNALLAALFAAGTAIAAARSRRTGDGLPALTAFMQLAFAFVFVWMAIGTVRYGPWWYLARGALTAGAFVVLVGLLADYVGLLRREHAKSRRLSARSAELAAIETRLREHNAELRRAHAQLEEMDQRKNEFIAVLSHELRNPLAPIVNALFVLERSDPAAPQTQRAHALLARQVGHLTRLLDDLLDVTRIGRGKVALRRSALDLCALVRESVDDRRGLMQERGVELAVALPPEPVWVDGDETRLAQVVGNLLQNAAAFTPPGGRVTLSLTKNGDGAEVRVRDTGPGFEPALVERLFEPFTQIGVATPGWTGGLGLGLAIVKGLVELHGGQVSAASAGPGRGAEFTIRLPAVARQQDARGASPRDVAAVARRRVLVVDDNRDAAESLAAVVQLLGHEVQLAFDGAQALDVARKTAPHVVLCDLGMPGMNGYDVARALRAEHGSALRLVAVSGYAQPGDRRAAAEAGFDGHLAKPPEPQAIEREIARCAERAPAKRGGAPVAIERRRDDLSD
ncbi:MAG: hypothetical protein DCC71_00100 [Proteobacteria bacterium]|nr:MAG: hypothetical protein DCC71_00100 [Pseudomonadota bacterium]